MHQNLQDAKTCKYVSSRIFNIDAGEHERCSDCCHYYSSSQKKKQKKNLGESFSVCDLSNHAAT